MANPFLTKTVEPGITYAVNWLVAIVIVVAIVCAAFAGLMA